MFQWLDIDSAAYYADPAPEPSLSASLARTLIRRSPMHAYAAHPRLGAKPQSAPTHAQARGTLWHRILLGTGGAIEIVDATDWRTKAAREQRDAAHAAGKTAVLKAAYDEAADMARELEQRLRDHGVRLTGRSEQVLMWQRATQHGTIWCRAMMDHVVQDASGLVVYDLKTCQSAEPSRCASSAFRYDYYLQASAYTDGCEAAGHSPRFLFVFIEPQPPYAIQVAELDSVGRELGRHAWQHACETWARCMSSGEWPGYGPGIATLETPAWAINDLLSRTPHADLDLVDHLDEEEDDE